MVFRVAEHQIECSHALEQMADVQLISHANNFDFIESHKGMFTVLGFSEDKMTQLREKYGVYGVGDGRINIAGLTESKIPYVADAINKVSQP